MYIHYVQWRVVCSPNLVLPSCIEDFTQPPKPTSNLTILPISSEGLLNLLTLLASSLHASTCGCHFCCSCWFACFSWPVYCLPFQRLPSGFCWILLSPRSTCLVRWAVSSLLSVSWMVSLDIWSRWHILSVMLLCRWSVCTGCSRCTRPSFWFVLWHWGWSFWSLVGDTSTSTLCRSCLPTSRILPLFWLALVSMVIVPAW